MLAKKYYPFSAIYGQEDAKLAVILNLINPNIGGVLLCGEKGTAKSTLVRSIEDISGDMKVINVPLGITEDRLIGSADLTVAVKSGKKQLQMGLLQEADKNILYIDEVNLLSEHICNIIMTVFSQKYNYVENEGMSYSNPCDFVLIGSMNPEEGNLKPSLLDKFGLFVNIKCENDLDIRCKIVKLAMEYENNPIDFCKKYEINQQHLREKIQIAREKYQSVVISEEIYQLIAETSAQAFCQGNRCEIVLTEGCRALAAWEDRAFVTEKDVEKLAPFVLSHRMRDLPDTIECEAENNNEDTNSDVTEEDNTNKPENNENRNNNLDNSGEEIANNENEEEKLKQYNITLSKPDDKKHSNEGTGKRTKVKSDNKSGRHIKNTMTKPDDFDISFSSTLKEAAIHQKNREKNLLAITVKDSDFRYKIRERRTGATIVFVVDASGSMGAKKRMKALKGAVISLLNEAYQKRDKVSIVAFRKNDAEVILDITRSVDLAQKQLLSMQTGGKTPMAHGIYKALEILKSEKAKNPKALQYLILLSDGKTNVPYKTDNPQKDALEAAEIISSEDIIPMVLDCEKAYIKFEFAKEIADAMNARYIKLDKISETEIMSQVKDLII